MVEEWSVKVIHVYRESNNVANRLAQYAVDLPPELCTSQTIPNGMGALFFANIYITSVS